MGDAALCQVTAADVKRQAPAFGFDLCGIASADAHPELQLLRQWLDRGYAAEMGYLHRSAERRADVRAVLPSARTVIALATIYNTDRPYSIENADTRQAALARYAWGDDYHTVIGTRLEAFLAWLRTAAGQGFEGRAYVDTGPIQERVYAQYAGIGWVGKNTCLINPEKGSWLFLSEIICNLPLEVDAPGLDQCGSCTLCLDACPTGALVAPRQLDSNRCLSYLTIELKGSIPASARDTIGEHAYGCDICQEVCPWNQSPAEPHPAFAPRESYRATPLRDLLKFGQADFSSLFAGSAIKRAKLAGMRRNAAAVLSRDLEGAADDRRID